MVVVVIVAMAVVVAMVDMVQCCLSLGMVGSQGWCKCQTSSQEG